VWDVLRGVHCEETAAVEFRFNASTVSAAHDVNPMKASCLYNNGAVRYQHVAIKTGACCVNFTPRLTDHIAIALAECGLFYFNGKRVKGKGLTRIKASQRHASLFN